MRKSHFLVLWTTTGPSSVGYQSDIRSDAEVNDSLGGDRVKKKSGIKVGDQEFPYCVLSRADCWLLEATWSVLLLTQGSEKCCLMGLYLILCLSLLLMYFQPFRPLEQTLDGNCWTLTTESFFLLFRMLRHPESRLSD